MLIHECARSHPSAVYLWKTKKTHYPPAKVIDTMHIDVLGCSDMSIKDDSNGSGALLRHFHLTTEEGLWKRLERFIQRKSRRVEAKVTIGGEINNALKKYLDQQERTERG